MKILLVNNDKGWGGGQEFLKGLSLELRNAGFDVHMAVRAGSPSEERFESLGLSVHSLSRRGMKALLSIRTLAAVMRREHFDVISINREHDIFSTVLARRLAFPFSCPGKLLMTYHVGIARKQFFLGAMDAILCVSNHVRARLLERHPGIAAKSRVVHNGIRVTACPDLEKFSVIRKRHFFHGVGGPLIGMVGPLWKNQTELVDCIPLLRREFPAIRVAFVGDDTELPYAAQLKEKIREMGVGEHVMFTGKVPHEQMADIFYDFDLTVSTFRNEGHPLAPLESLAAGTPVVAYNEGGQVDILQGEEAGILVDGGTAEFVAAVAELLRDDERRFAMGRRGVELVNRKFTVASMVDRYCSLFRELLAAG